MGWSKRVLRHSFSASGFPMIMPPKKGQKPCVFPFHSSVNGKCTAILGGMYSPVSMVGKSPNPEGPAMDQWSFSSLGKASNSMRDFPASRV
jgi:hypothetical protein